MAFLRRFLLSIYISQLEEATAVLAEEQEAAGRLRRSQSEAQKQAQALEFNLRELVDNCTQLENAKMGLEQQLMGLQADLEAERRDRSLGTEVILDLQGETGAGAGARVVRSAEFALLLYFKVKVQTIY